MTRKTKQATKAAPKVPVKKTEADLHEKVPEAAEDMEHTLRRLNAEKEKKRARNPGLYL